MAAALDEQEYGSDIVVENNGAKAVYTKDLESTARKLRIDYSDNWFMRGFRVY